MKQPTVETGLVEKARAFALQAHGDQRYGDLPYGYHLERVVFAVENYSDVLGPLEVVMAAAWLHDVVEDTDVTLNDIRLKFGGRVARLVDCVTDEPGENRLARKAVTYTKLATGPVEARTIKLADRLANMEASIEDPKRSKMYADEFPEFIHVCGRDSANIVLTNRLMWVFVDSTTAIRRRQNHQGGLRP